jgi:hypothetical protein
VLGVKSLVHDHHLVIVVIVGRRQWPGTFSPEPDS